jgi:hypothetical protein
MSTSDINQQLTHIHNLIQQDRVDEAINLLNPIIQQNPDSVDAWWLMANAVETPEDARYALNNVLRLDPNHQEASEMMIQLNELYPPGTNEMVGGGYDFGVIQDEQPIGGADEAFDFDSLEEDEDDFDMSAFDSEDFGGDSFDDASFGDDAFDAGAFGAEPADAGGDIFAESDSFDIDSVVGDDEEEYDEFDDFGGIFDEEPDEEELAVSEEASADDAASGDFDLDSVLGSFPDEEEPVAEPEPAATAETLEFEDDDLDDLDAFFDEEEEAGGFEEAPAQPATPQEQDFDFDDFGGFSDEPEEDEFEFDGMEAETVAGIADAVEEDDDFGFDDFDFDEEAEAEAPSGDEMPDFDLDLEEEEEIQVEEKRSRRPLLLFLLLLVAVIAIGALVVLVLPGLTGPAPTQTPQPTPTTEPALANLRENYADQLADAAGELSALDYAETPNVFYEMSDMGPAMMASSCMASGPNLGATVRESILVLSEKAAEIGTNEIEAIGLTVSNCERDDVLYAVLAPASGAVDLVNGDTTLADFQKSWQTD